MGTKNQAIKPLILPDYSKCKNLADAINLIEQANGKLRYYIIKKFVHIGYNTWKGILTGTAKLQNKTKKRLFKTLNIPETISNATYTIPTDNSNNDLEWIERLKQNTIARKIAHELGLKDV